MVNADGMMKRQIETVSLLSQFSTKPNDYRLSTLELGGSMHDQATAPTSSFDSLPSNTTLSLLSPRLVPIAKF
jgi:hypothetical protein